MNSTSLTPELRDGLLQHLQAETDLLTRIQELSQGLTVGGFKTASLLEQQPELSVLVSDLLEMHLRRANLRQAISQVWACEPDAVRLSRIALDTPQATEALQRQREQLLQLTVRAKAGLGTAEGTLRGWSGIVSFVLGELLDAGNHSDRYTATGHRVAPIRTGGIDVRS